MDRIFPQQAVIHSRHGVSRCERFYEALLYKALEPMRLGSLQVDLPDGRRWQFGSPTEWSDSDWPAAARLHIRRAAFFKKSVLFGDVGFGESYVDGDWDTDNIASVVSWFILNREDAPTLSASRNPRARVNWLRWVNQLVHHFRANSLRGSKHNISAHYDLSNDLFAQFLDPTMTYSCGYFSPPELNLQEAQIEKYDQLCRKLRIQASDHVLEMGCGWGGFSRHAARKYGCKVTAVTISEQQFQYARLRADQEGLKGQIDLRLLDYRRVEGQYDKIVSIEMLEAVGHRYLETFFRQCHALLKPMGLLGLQVITCSDRRYHRLRRNVDWIQKHIFPGSLILSVAAINQAVNRAGDLFLHDLEDMGRFYARTLSVWHQNFNRNLARVRQLGFDEAFIRKWNYYLMYCQAAFAMRHNSVLQAVYTRQNNYRL
jgi:cyclopropane-fatty-acyl-phospholipid synthase